MTLTLSNSQEKVTRQACDLSRGLHGGSVYVVRAGYGFKAVTAADLAGETTPKIIATFRKGEEVEAPETFGYAV